jgi:hypothetical protein
MIDIRNAHKILVGKPERERPLGRYRHKWKDSIRMDLRETRWEHVDWIDLAEDRDQQQALVNMVVNLQVL